MKDDIYLVVDQGASKTIALAVSPTGSILAFADDYALVKNHGRERIGPEIRLKFVVRNLVEKIGNRNICFSKSCIAVNGINTPEDAESFRKRLLGIVAFGETLIINDSIAALHGGFIEMPQEENLVVICAGTRFNCHAETAKGGVATLGWRVSCQDHGAFALGGKAWDAAVDGFNGLKAATKLTDLFIRHFSTPGMDALMEGFFSGAIPFDTPSFAPLLFDAASIEDEVALGIVDMFASRWVSYAKLSLQLAGEKELTHGNIVLSGGVFKFDRGFLQKAIMLSAKEKLPLFSICCAQFEPVGGAALFLFRKIYDKAKMRGIAKEFSSSYLQKIKMRHL